MKTDPVVHIVDDDPAMRDSLQFLLESAGFRPITYAAAESLLIRGAALEPGCIVTDIRMPDMSGLDLVRELKQRGLNLPVVVITGHGDIPLAVEAMRQGVVDFLEKPFEEDAILSAIGRALKSSTSHGGRSADAAQFRAAFEKLSARERDVLHGVVAGKLNKVIAFELGISPRTVEIYRANVMTKTGASSLSDLVRMALLADFE
jgi:two-component system response regulator FixJ